MKNLFLLIAFISASAFGVTGNKVWRVPNGGSLPAWGPVNLADGTNAVTGQLSRANLPSVGQQISSSSGGFGTLSGSFVSVTNLSVSITTTGRPVMLMLIPDGSANNVEFGPFSSSNGITPQGFFQFTRGGSSLGAVFLSGTTSPASGTVFAGGLNPLPVQLDTPSAGTYTYAFQMKAGGGQMNCQWVELVAYEL